MNQIDSAAKRNEHKLPDLPYPYDALLPYIDEETMRVHHDKHHKAYVDKLNAALEKYPELYKKPVEELLKDLRQVPEDIRDSVKNQGGGHLNHSVFWPIMTTVKGSTGGGEPGGKLLEAIRETFGGFDQFKEEMSQKAVDHFGSGWAWFVKDRNGKLKVYSLPNQDSPLSQGDTPLLLIDVWEHAYYLKYQNRRAEYIKNFWNVVNWPQVEKLYEE